MYGYTEIGGERLSYEPMCTICIANYNGLDYLSECVESIKKQTFNKYPLEIIVHDDGSTDDSVVWIRKNYPEIRLLISETNVGFCESNNRMVDVARGRYILLLNNDAALFNNAIELLYNRSAMQEKQGILTLPQYNRGTSENIDHGNDLDLFLNPVPRSRWTDSNVSTVHGACLWMPKSLWKEMGGFPNWFESVGEDLYLCIYSKCLGYPVEIVRGSGFWHWVGSSFGGGKVQKGKLKSTYKRRYLSERNKSYVMILFYPNVVFLVLPLHLILLGLEGFVLSVLSRNTRIFNEVYGKAVCNIVSRLPYLLRKRREIRSGVKLRSLSLTPLLRRPRKLDMLVKFGLPEVS